MIASKLESLRHFQGRLLGELEESAQEVVNLIKALRALEPGSEEYDELEAKLYVSALQLELDAGDVRKVMDEITDALPEDEDDA